jgi:hypothetical protein
MTTQTQNKRIQTSMPRVGFESTIPVFEHAKTVHALDRAAIVIGRSWCCCLILGGNSERARLLQVNILEKWKGVLHRVQIFYIYFFLRFYIRQCPGMRSREDTDTIDVILTILRNHFYCISSNNYYITIYV